MQVKSRENLALNRKTRDREEQYFLAAVASICPQTSKLLFRLDFFFDLMRRMQEQEGHLRMSSPSRPTSIYHVAGVDERERGFNRQVHVIPCGEGFQARLRYEMLQIEVEPVLIEDQALQRLIQVLHDRGFKQLRTQRIFIGNQYLGNQQLWIEYPDPVSAPDAKKTWSAWFRGIFNRFSPRKIT